MWGVSVCLLVSSMNAHSHRFNIAMCNEITSSPALATDIPGIIPLCWLERDGSGDVLSTTYRWRCEDVHDIPVRTANQLVTLLEPHTLIWVENDVELELICTQNRSAKRV